MNSGIRYFFDLPVYRLPEAEYYEQRSRYIDRVLFPPNAPNLKARRDYAAQHPSANESISAHLAHTYGGAWIYNEIIGFIQLHFLGTQVRGEYYAVKAKRIVRSRHKTLEYKTWKLADKIDIPYNASSRQVLAKVREYIEACKAELPGRFIDTAKFEALAPFINWKLLFQK